MPAPGLSRFRVDWVLVQELAVGPAPRAERHLERLTEAGVTAVLSLCSEQEAPPPPQLSGRFQCTRGGRRREQLAAARGRQCGKHLCQQARGKRPTATS